MELLDEILHRMRHATWRGAWEWLHEGYGLRLIPVIALLWAIGRLVYALAIE